MPTFRVAEEKSKETDHLIDFHAHFLRHQLKEAFDSAFVAMLHRYDDVEKTPKRVGATLHAQNRYLLDMKNDFPQNEKCQNASVKSKLRNTVSGP